MPPDMQDIFETLFSNLSDKCGRSQNMPNIKIYTTGNRFMNDDNIFESDISSNIMTPLPINKTLNISMKQSYEGGSYPITINKELCYNNKITTEEETLYVNLPMGIDDKEIINTSLKILKSSKYKNSRISLGNFKLFELLIKKLEIEILLNISHFWSLCQCRISTKYSSHLFFKGKFFFSFG